MSADVQPSQQLLFSHTSVTGTFTLRTQQGGTHSFLSTHASEILTAGKRQQHFVGSASCPMRPVHSGWWHQHGLQACGLIWQQLLGIILDYIPYKYRRLCTSAPIVFKRLMHCFAICSLTNTKNDLCRKCLSKLIKLKITMWVQRVWSF